MMYSSVKYFAIFAALCLLSYPFVSVENEFEEDEELSMKPKNPPLELGDEVCVGAVIVSSVFFLSFFDISMNP